MLSSSALAATKCARATAALAALEVAACDIKAVCEAHPLVSTRTMNSARWIRGTPCAAWPENKSGAWQAAPARSSRNARWRGCVNRQA